MRFDGFQYGSGVAVPQAESPEAVQSVAR